MIMQKHLPYTWDYKQRHYNKSYENLSSKSGLAINSHCIRALVDKSSISFEKDILFNELVFLSEGQ